MPPSGPPRKHSSSGKGRHVRRTCASRFRPRAARGHGPRRAPAQHARAVARSPHRSPVFPRLLAAAGRAHRRRPLRDSRRLQAPRRLVSGRTHRGPRDRRGARGPAGVEGRPARSQLPTQDQRPDGRGPRGPLPRRRGPALAARDLAPPRTRSGLGRPPPHARAQARPRGRRARRRRLARRHRGPRARVLGRRRTAPPRRGHRSPRPALARSRSLPCLLPRGRRHPDARGPAARTAHRRSRPRRLRPRPVPPRRRGPRSRAPLP